MTRTLLRKGRVWLSLGTITTVLTAALVAVLIGLAGTPATAEAVTDPLLKKNYDVFNPNYDPLTGLPWWATSTPSSDISSLEPTYVLDPGIDPLTGLPWWATSTPSSDPGGSTGSAVSTGETTTAPAPKAQATMSQLPATGGNGDAMLFALVAGALLVIGGLPKFGGWIVRKVRS